MAPSTDLRDKKKYHSYSLGIIGEYVIMLYFFMRFYHIVERRFKVSTGEIDLIIRKGNTLVFCEIKTRKKIDGPLDLVRARQLERIKRSGEVFVKRNQRYRNYFRRYDIVIFCPPFKVIRFKNV